MEEISDRNRKKLLRGIPPHSFVISCFKYHHLLCIILLRKDIMPASHQHAKNPLVLSKTLGIVKALEGQGLEPTFNAILAELSAERVLAFHRSLRKYLDLLVAAKLLSITNEKPRQPNIREKQVYHTKGTEPILEAGEKAFLFHGLNWVVPSPMSLKVKTDLQALARGTLSGKIVYASLEDTIAHSPKILPARSPEVANELMVFVTALLATQKVDLQYLLFRARREGTEKEVMEILKVIDRTFSSRNPDVEDIFTLYKLRDNYLHLNRRFPRTILREVPPERRPAIVSQNEVVEYAGKQLGLKG